MSKEIVFEQINVEDVVQKNRLQFEAKIFNMVNGKQTYADEETGFVFQKYSGFAPKAFIKEVKNRDFVRISLDPEQQSCTNLEKTLNEYDDSFEASRKNVFGKYDRLYKFARSVKKPKSNTEEEISDDEDEDAEKEAKEAKDIKETKDIQPKYNSCKMKLKMDWFYYYQGERLDKSNTNTVKKACTDSMTKNKNIDKEKRKALLGTLTFKLNFKDENDKTVQKDVKMDELEQRREIDTKVFYRRPQTLPSNTQEFLKKQRGNSTKEIEEYETELVNLFGDPQEPKDVRHPDDLDKYYNFNSWIRLLYSPYRVWASKTKDEDVEVDGKIIAGKRKSGIKYVINSIDIIQLPFENNLNSSHKIVYAKYAFGKRGNDELLINQSIDTVFTAVEKSNQDVKSTQPTDKVDKSDKVDKVEMNDKSNKNDKKEKIQMKVESESDEESEESEDSEESESDESESEPEPEPVKKGKSKTVTETAKNTKSKDLKKSK